MVSLASDTPLSSKDVSQPTELTAEIQTEIQDIIALYKNDYWFGASNRLELLIEKYYEQQCTTTTSSTSTTDTTPTATRSLEEEHHKFTHTPLPAIFTHINNVHSPIIARVHRVCRELKHVMREFETTDGWTLKSWDSSTDQIWYKEETDGTHSFRVEGFIDAPLFNLMALIYEFDLFPLWFPLLTHASQVAQPSKFSKFARIVAWAPWPMAHREALLRGYGDVYNGDSVAVFAKDAVPDDLIGTSCEGKVELPIEGADGTCRLNVHKCAFHFIPVVDEKVIQKKHQDKDEDEDEDEEKEETAESKGGTSTKQASTNNKKRSKRKKKKKKSSVVGAGGRVLTKVFFNVDLKIAFLPDLLLNVIIGKFCGAILMLVRKYAHPKEMRNSEYEKRIEANTEVYSEMKRRIEENLTPEKIAENVNKYGTKRQQEIFASLKEVQFN
jgi:hypothetical protein